MSTLGSVWAWVTSILWSDDEGEGTRGCLPISLFTLQCMCTPVVDLREWLLSSWDSIRVRVCSMEYNQGKVRSQKCSFKELICECSLSDGNTIKNILYHIILYLCTAVGVSSVIAKLIYYTVLIFYRKIMSNIGHKLHTFIVELKHFTGFHIKIDE